jgi:hypothetical protein
MKSTVVALGILATLAVGARQAAAQPGMAPPPSAYAPETVQVTPEEYKLLQRGYISDGQHIGGGLLGTFMGLGIGHAVQGRWGETGWIFTFGEAATFGLFAYGLVDCVAESTEYDAYGNDYQSSDDCAWGSLIVGMLGMTVLRVWEVVDVWAGPANHNRKLRELRWRLGLDAPPRRGWATFAAPPKRGSGAVAGVVYRF